MNGYIPEGGVWTAEERALDHHDPEEWPRAEATVAALVRVLEDCVPMLVRLGDFIGNGDTNPSRPGSLGARCDLIGDVKTLLAAVKGKP